MSRDEYVSKLRDALAMLDYLASEDEGLAIAVTGLSAVCKQVDVYIDRLEYNNAMESFNELPPELKETFLVQARNIYEGEDV